MLDAWPMTLPLPAGPEITGKGRSDFYPDFLRYSSACTRATSPMYVGGA